MIVAGLTGSIGMGKSTVAAYLRGRGIPVLDADQVVHDLYAGRAAPLIEAVFPGTTQNGAVDRVALGQRVLSSKEALKKLEAVIHPLVREVEWQFLLKQQDKGCDLAVLEIPLLYETAAHTLFDAIIVVSAPAEAQRERLLARPGMTLEKIEAIAARQWPDAVKCAKADFVVDTGAPLEDTKRQIDAVLRELLKRPPLAFQRWADLHSG
ncbi:MAG TPA: dephospho-CoA kinase [Hyphomicrobiales bacterium]|nr:dephospho-CoA kinase [Hyphomicrobiales bacterium]